MPRIAPFRGLHYAKPRFSGEQVPPRVRTAADAGAPPSSLVDLTDLACPPYDVIDDAQRDGLLRRDPRNCVRLEHSAEADPHSAASGALSAWTAEGTLVRMAGRVAYRYRHATTADPDLPSVDGLVTRVALQPWGDGILPHEHTMPGPKADRLALLRATRTQLSPILAVYFDGAEDPERIARRPVVGEWRARDGDGLLHRLEALEVDQAALDGLAGQQLYVADGHHRYETGLAYQAEVRADPRWAAAPPGSLAADWIMALLVNAERVEMEILPTHRLLLDADDEALRELADDADPLWRSTPVPPVGLAAALDAHRDGATPAFGLVLPGGRGHLLVGDAGAIGDRLRNEPMSAAARALDLAAIHVTVLGDRLGISADDVAAGARLAYTRSEADARERVANGHAVAAILVRPTRLDQMAAVARAGDVMPQKSTYFYPKLLTGMVFNPLED